MRMSLSHAEMRDARLPHAKVIRSHEFRNTLDGLARECPYRMWPEMRDKRLPHAKVIRWHEFRNTLDAVLRMRMHVPRAHAYVDLRTRKSCVTQARDLDERSMRRVRFRKNVWSYSYRMRIG